MQQKNIVCKKYLMSSFIWILYCLPFRRALRQWPGPRPRPPSRSCCGSAWCRRWCAPRQPATSSPSPPRSRTSARTGSRWSSTSGRSVAVTIKAGNEPSWSLYFHNHGARAFSWLKDPTALLMLSHLRHYAKWVSRCELGLLTQS